MSTPPPSSERVYLKVLPWNLRLKAERGSTVLKALARSGIHVESTCGGKGTCGKCKVEISFSGAESKGQEQDNRVHFQEILACQTPLKEDAVVRVPMEKEGADLKSAMSVLEKDVEPDSCVKLETLKLTETPDSYLEELQRRLPPGTEPENRLAILRDAAPLAGEEEPASAVLIDGVLAGIEKVKKKPPLGVAVDLGTTTVMGALWDLNDGSSLGTTSRENLQKLAGADVISRSNYTLENREGLELLRKKTAETINGIIGQLLESASARREEIYELVVAGNTTMLHLLWGVFPRALVLAPYHPVFRSGMSAPARELGIEINPRGRIYSVPCVSSYVGADAVSAVLATGLHRGEEPRLLIDIGTNGEMVLGGKERIVACSTAAGPAFEGARIRQGMRGEPGAMERVEISGGEVSYGVIDDQPPRGICGSGLLDAVAALLQAGVIHPLGTFKDKASLPPSLQERVVQGDRGTEFMLAFPEESSTPEGVSLNRKDIGELQLAKGAICAGIKILLRQLGIEMEEVKEVLLAGAFGNYLRKESASAIGVWPSYPVEKVKAVGNAAGIGAQMLLLSGSLRREGEELHRRVEHLNLGSHPDFTGEFTRSMHLSETL